MGSRPKTRPGDCDPRRAFPTWLQVGSTVAAAGAALASWTAVVQARKAAQEAREAEAEALLPLLLVSLNFNLPGAGNPTMGVALYNASGGIAKNVAVLLVSEDAYAREVVGFLRPGETVTFGSELRAALRLAGVGRDLRGLLPRRRLDRPSPDKPAPGRQPALLTRCLRVGGLASFVFVDDPDHRLGPRAFITGARGERQAPGRSVDQQALLAQGFDLIL